MCIVNGTREHLDIPEIQFVKPLSEFECAWPSFRNVLPSDSFNNYKAGRKMGVLGNMLDSMNDSSYDQETVYLLETAANHQHLIYLVFAEFFHLSSVFDLQHAGRRVIVSKEMPLDDVPQKNVPDILSDLIVYMILTQDLDHCLSRHNLRWQIFEDVSYVLYDFGKIEAQAPNLQKVIEEIKFQTENAAYPFNLIEQPGARAKFRQAYQLSFQKVRAIRSRYEGDEGLLLLRAMIDKAYLAAEENVLIPDALEFQEALIQNCEKLLEELAAA